MNPAPTATPICSNPPGSPGLRGTLYVQAVRGAFRQASVVGEDERSAVPVDERREAGYQKRPYGASREVTESGYDRLYA